MLLFPWIPAWGGRFSSGDIQSGLTGMNIAEVKKNAMTILSTKPFRMFISGAELPALIE
jgi:hypothetical protein